MGSGQTSNALALQASLCGSLCGHDDYADMRLNGLVLLGFSVPYVSIIMGCGALFSQTEGDEKHSLSD